ncbi:regulatory protein, Fis family [Chitinophaga jiangningensis]|uniref:Regulatory protein, Fis family n=1 Tax=Chitinophaga jiangningensis TaxID=1419482 RepID=A0A1M7CIE7_9BACT|nr:helix-turn-helix domain-containing protein [Chitinophaga jiangningensis]SHL66569.1 regulatory protein, Fis family [Chitinophaga jiangningensis]
MIKASSDPADVLLDQHLERDIQSAIGTAFVHQQHPDQLIAAMSRQLLTIFKAHYEKRIQQRQQPEQENIILKGEMKARRQPPALTGITLHRQIKTIDENERDHIMEVLRKTKGKIAGAGGAAQLLGVPPTTLHSKMKKLGIAKMHH